MAQELTDPFTLVLQGLWALLEGKETFKDLVRENNRIKLYQPPNNRPRRPQKDSLVEQDVPEVMIYPSSVRSWEQRDSSMASINKVFAIMVTSGERLVDHGKFFPVEWAIAQAMFDFDSLLDLEYEYPDPNDPTNPDANLKTTFIKKLEMPSGENGLTDAELNRDLKGWTAVWECDVFMWFSNQVWRGG